MRVAALYDIHSDLPALEAAFGEARQAAVDIIIVGGDVLPGPMPVEVLQRLLDIPVATHFIRGNGEVAVLQELAGKAPAGAPKEFRPAIAWVAERVQEYSPMLANWPMTLKLQIDGLGTVLFCHATPRNEDECFTRVTPAERLLPVFDGLGANVVVCGHTHMQFDRMVGHTRVVNAGSVGMPFGKPGADWLVLGPDVTFMHTDYDLTKAAERIRATGMPWPEDFAARHVLQPPSEAEMLEALTRASI